MKFKIISKTNEEYISLTDGCLRFTDSYQFLSCSLEELGKTKEDDDFNVLNKEFPKKCQYLNKKVSYAYEYFKYFDEDYQKPVSNLKNISLVNLKNVLMMKK